MFFTVLLSVFLSLGLGECLLRIFFAEALAFFEDERNLAYRHDPELGWFPIENSKRRIQGSRWITVEHNAEGFRDRPHGVKTKPRIAFLGDSFVWGYDVEVEERFTEKLAERLPEWEILNFGVSGYGTDQSLLLLEKFYDRYTPEVVCLVFTSTDRWDNRSNRRYLGYYKPYFQVADDGLRLCGVPVPKSVNYLFRSWGPLSSLYIVRAGVRLAFRLFFPPIELEKDPTLAILERMHNVVRAKGAFFMMLLEKRDPEVEAFCERERIPMRWLETSRVYPSHGSHWTPDGHAEVAAIALRLLEETHLLERGMKKAKEQEEKR